MIRSIFYARFHAEQGPKILHQVPEGSITHADSHSALRQPLFDYTSILDYIIPRQEFCDRLVTACISRYRVIGFPVCVSDYDGKYDRNEFIFNFALVIDEDVEDWASYASVIRKLGRLLRALEEQGGFLSKDESATGAVNPSSYYQHSTSLLSPTAGSTKPSTPSIPATNGKLYALCEMILEDLNNYRECMIPIDDSNTINLKLFPQHRPPAPVHAWHVPLLTISLTSFSTTHLSSDLTLQRILPYINGIHSISQIAHLADTDLSLTRLAVQHLVYYACVLLLDVFHFGAIYAPTAEIGFFITDPAVQEECARYVAVPHATQSPSTPTSAPTSPSTSPTLDPARPTLTRVDTHTLVDLYVALRPGTPLRTFCLENLDRLAGVDVRRLITFGVIKGFLYRVHKYAIATASSLSSPVKGSGEGGGGGGAIPATQVRAGAERGDARWGDGPELLPLERYLDGIHSFDEICTELGMGEREVVGKMMKGFGEVQIIQK